VDVRDKRGCEHHENLHLELVVTFFFESCVVAIGVDGIVSIALIDHGFDEEHVMLCRCGKDAAIALCSALMAAINHANNNDAAR
jgi:hypothetical protein